LYFHKSQIYLSDILSHIAGKHSRNCLDYNIITHNLLGKSPSDRCGEWGIRSTYIAENCVQVPLGTDPCKAAELWFTSDGHNKNILNDNLKYHGIGTQINNGYL
jgi:uncharacterized protein YkwD